MSTQTSVSNGNNGPRFIYNLLNLRLKFIPVTIHSDMVQVTRKDEREANENVIRRFNRKVLQSGVLSTAKASMRFAKPISKTERRNKAIIRKARKADKMAKMRLGVR